MNLRIARSAGRSAAALSDRPLIRMLDANFNRALEGCRVIEDALRLGSRSASARGFDPRFSKLRNIRHRLSFLRSRFGLRRLAAARNVQDDPGSFRKALWERRYRSCHSMLAANLQRVKESLRVIEEVSRALPAGRLFADAKQLRFQAYALEENILAGRKWR